MRTLESQLVISPRATTSRVVEASTPIVEFLQTPLIDEMNYVVIANGEGQILGVLEIENLLRVCRSWNEHEERRWYQMPIAALLPVQLVPVTDLGVTSTSVRGERLSCSAIENEDGILALIADDDVFVSWRVVQSAIEDTCVDPVTRLPNRSMFDRRLADELVRANRTEHSVAVVLIDIDHFKEINDNYGHSVGDDALRLIADCMRQTLRSTDFLARYGGDEFALICTGCLPGNIAVPVRKLQDCVEETFRNSSLALPPVTLSIGACVEHESRKRRDACELVELADMCLYRAKDNGRNCAMGLELQGEGHCATPTLIERTSERAFSDF